MFSDLVESAGCQTRMESLRERWIARKAEEKAEYAEYAAEQAAEKARWQAKFSAAESDLDREWIMVSSFRCNIERDHSTSSQTLEKDSSDSDGLEVEPTVNVKTPAESPVVQSREWWRRHSVLLQQSRAARKKEEQAREAKIIAEARAENKRQRAEAKLQRPSLALAPRGRGLLDAIEENDRRYLAESCESNARSPIPHFNDVVGVWEDIDLDRMDGLPAKTMRKKSRVPTTKKNIARPSKSTPLRSVMVRIQGHPLEDPDSESSERPLPVLRVTPTLS